MPQASSSSFPLPPQWKRSAAPASASSTFHTSTTLYARAPYMASAPCRASGGAATVTMVRPSPSTGGGGGAGGQQRPGRLRECMSRIPLCTTLITILCLSLHICVLVLKWDIGQYAISPAAVLQGKEYYRLMTAPFFHVNLLHIAMNMLSFVGIGAFLEFQQGTLYLFLSIAYSCVLTNLVYIGICEILLLATKNAHWYHYTSVGFSGVIFQLAVLETYTAPPGSTRSVFGFCQVPAKLYPWALLVIIQVVMPRVSWVGHLAGLLVGVLQAYGFLGCLFPPRACVNRAEASPGCSPLVRCGQYILAPEASERDRNALCALLSRCCFGGFGGGGGGSSGGRGGGGGGGGFLGSPGRRARNFGGGVTGTAASGAASSSMASSSSPRGPLAAAGPGVPVAVASSSSSSAGAVAKAKAPGLESPHTRVAGADGRGWRRIEDRDDELEEEQDLEVGGGLVPSSYQQQQHPPPPPPGGQGGGGVGGGGQDGGRRIVL